MTAEKSLRGMTVTYKKEMLSQLVSSTLQLWLLLNTLTIMLSWKLSDSERTLIPIYLWCNYTQPPSNDGSPRIITIIIFEHSQIDASKWLLLESAIIDSLAAHKGSFRMQQIATYQRIKIQIGQVQEDHSFYFSYPSFKRCQTFNSFSAKPSQSISNQLQIKRLQYVVMMAEMRVEWVSWRMAKLEVQIHLEDSRKGCQNHKVIQKNTAESYCMVSEGWLQKIVSPSQEKWTKGKYDQVLDKEDYGLSERQPLKMRE